MMLTYLYNISGDSLVRGIHRLKLEKVWKDELKNDENWSVMYNISGDNLIRWRGNIYKLYILYVSLKETILKEADTFGLAPNSPPPSPPWQIDNGFLQYKLPEALLLWNRKAHAAADRTWHGGALCDRDGGALLPRAGGAGGAAHGPAHFPRHGGAPRHGNHLGIFLLLWTRTFV